jgi:hypothetical protein
LDETAIVLEKLSGQGLGKIVSALVSGINFDHLEFAGVVPKPVPFIQEISGAVGDAVVRSKEECALIVFEHAGLN